MELLYFASDFLIATSANEKDAFGEQIEIARDR
jgi:hypothetical protein